MTLGVVPQGPPARAVLMDPSRSPLQRRLNRVLLGAGFDVELLEDGGAVSPAGAAGAKLLHLGPVSMRDVLLRAASAGHPTVIYGPAEALSLQDLRSPHLIGLLSIGERLDLEGEILSLARHLQGLPLPPLQAYLLWGAPAYLAHVGDIHARESVVNRIRELSLSLRAPRRVADTAAEVAHELLTNAMYTAPVSASGELRYAHDRTASLELPSSDRVSFSFGSDGLRLVMEVADRFGRLRREHLSASLTRAAAGQINEGQGGAGIGLSMVVRGSEVLQVDVQPGARTRVTAILSLEPRPSAGAGSGPVTPGARARQSVLLSFGGEQSRPGSVV